METNEGKACACSCAGNDEEALTVEMEVPASNRMMTARYIALGIPLLVAWWFVYKSLAPFAGWFARHLVEFLSSHFV